MILDIQDAIVARLQAAAIDAHIATADELSEIDERAQVTPAIHVVYSGYAPTKEVGGGFIQEIETRWTIVVAVRSARRNGVAEKASPLIDAAITTLAGWRPGPGHTPLKLAPGGGAAHNPGFSYYPLAFSTRETVRGDKTK